MQELQTIVSMILMPDLLPLQTLSIDPCFYFGEQHKATLAGPLLVEDDKVFVPKPVDTSNVSISVL